MRFTEYLYRRSSLLVSGFQEPAVRGGSRSILTAVTVFSLTNCWEAGTSVCD